MRKIVASLAALTLIVPAVPATARSIMVDICGAPGVRLALPVPLPVPQEGDGHSCCKKGCHATNERKKRVVGEADDLSGDDCC